MNTMQIQFVNTVAQLRSFTRASHALHVSQPAISSNIQKLEEELGVELFDRSSVPIKLTYAGELFIKESVEMLQIEARLQNTMRDITDAKRGKIRLGLAQGMMPYVLPLLIESYHKTYPNIVICGMAMSEGEMEDAICQNQIDFGIISNMDNSIVSKNASLCYESIGSEELLLISSDNESLNRCLIDGLESTVDIEKLYDLPFIMPSDGTFLRAVYDDLFQKNGVCPNIVTTADDSITLLTLAGTGLAPAIVPEITTRWVHTVRDITKYSLSVNGTFLKLYVIYNSKAYIGEPEKHLIATLRRIISMQP